MALGNGTTDFIDRYLRETAEIALAELEAYGP